jgi:hypothetical protein
MRERRISGNSKATHQRLSASHTITTCTVDSHIVYHSATHQHGLCYCFQAASRSNVVSRCDLLQPTTVRSACVHWTSVPCSPRAKKKKKTCKMRHLAHNRESTDYTGLFTVHTDYAGPIRRPLDSSCVILAGQKKKKKKRNLAF